MAKQNFQEAEREIKGKENRRGPDPTVPFGAHSQWSKDLP